LKAPKRGLRSDLVGCYALFVGDRPLDSTYYGSSPKVRLDAMPLRGPIDSQTPDRVLRRLDLVGRLQDSSRRPFTYWAVDSVSGVVKLSFHNGFSGAVLSLREKERIDTLDGRIANYWDFGPGVSDRARVRAVRVPCL
jgi:hypothetical protein